MKLLLPVFILLAVMASAADTPQPVVPPPAQAKEDYNKFIETAQTRESLAECISKLDQLIDEGEHGVTDKLPDPGMVETTTKQGLHFEFSATIIEKEAVIYYLTVSRGGLEFKYSDAVKFASLFADRAALPHPINLTEGDKPVFYAQWLIKPSGWKSMKKLMFKYRAINRAEPDPFKAFSIAIERELEARSEAERKR